MERPQLSGGEPSTHGLSQFFFNFLTKLSTQSITKDLIHSPQVGPGNWSWLTELEVWGVGKGKGRSEKGKGLKF